MSSRNSLPIDVAIALKTKGRVVGCACRKLVSPGRAFDHMLANRRAARSEELCRARKEAERQRILADKERLKQLGGRARNGDEEREWRELIGRNPTLSISYFEKRLWEKSPAS